MKQLLILFFLLIGFSKIQAQEELFGKMDSVSHARSGFIIGVNSAFDIPAADMAKRFGLAYRLGPSIQYKTENNWMFGVKGEFMLSGNVNEDSLFYNIKDAYGGFINSSGQRTKVATYERGYIVGITAGKIFQIGKRNKDNGILVQSGIGFMQHKIKIFDKNNAIYALQGNYVKGYDRLANGLYIEQYVGYNYMSHKGYANFHIGLDIVAGFTQGRRDWLFDVMRPDNQKRLDVMFGIRGGWYIPIFKHKVEEMLF